MSRRKKAIRKRAAAARCNIYALWVESRQGPYPSIAEQELARIAVYASAVDHSNQTGAEIEMPLDDYSLVMGYIPRDATLPLP